LHGGIERVMGAYVVETPDGPGLVDCGPASTFGALKAGLEERGLSVRDLRHLLLSHIHLDHAGAAGLLVRENPELRVHVAEEGAFHLTFPEVLEFGAREVYGAQFDELWGEVVAVPEANVVVLEEHVAGFEAIATPGHAPHHFSFLDAEGTLYAGDAAGMRAEPERFVLPPMAPPDVDVAAWQRTISELEARRPACLALTHFGLVADPLEHLATLRERLTDWEAAVRNGMTQQQFVEKVRAEVRALGAPPTFVEVLPLAQTYDGLKLYTEQVPA
jgi:glyoxylase-like metal-dependent hydrolase (beta-lactamase superfamily II)